MISTKGIYPSVNMRDYCADTLMDTPTLSSGCAHTLVTRSPYHARFEHPRLGSAEREESKAADVGTAAHAMLLQNDETTLCVIEAKDFRTKAAQEARDDAYAAGLTPILADKMTEVRAMVKAARAYIDASELRGVFDDGLPEQTVIARLENAWCRARPDWLTESICLHYKTSTNANPDAWIRGQLQSEGYDMAHQFYRLALAEVGHEVRSVFLVQEQTAPYACSLVGLTPAYADLALRKVRRALALWRNCLADDRWPSYPTRICYAEPKPWQIADEDEREVCGFFGDDPLQKRHGLQA